MRKYIYPGPRCRVISWFGFEGMGRDRMGRERGEVRFGVPLLWGTTVQSILQPHECLINV